MGSLSPELVSLPAVVDRVAAETPNHVWARAAESPKQGPVIFHDITWSQLRNAIDCMARWLEDDLGLGDGDETVAYAGVNDIRYAIVVMAALKAGYKSLLLSPRNSREGHLALLKATQCTKFAFTPEVRGIVDGIAAEAALSNTSQVPELQDLLAAPYNGGYKSSFSSYLRDQDTVMILHSSGTTGLPKPITLKAGVLRVTSECTSMPVPDGRRNIPTEFYETRLLLTTVPFFHIFGVMLLARSLYYRGQIGLLPPGQLPTAELVLDAITQLQPSSVSTTPSILEDICNLPRGLDAISTLESVFYGGAPLAHSCGNQITRVTALLNGIGSTEAFNIPILIPADRADWECFEWNPNVGVVMEPTDDGELAELVIHRQPGNPYQTVFHNFPHLTEWRTNDLYERHPTKPALWKYVGRADDIIVLSNGEKTNPVTFEKAIEGHPWVKGALVVGAGQFQTGLIVELHAEQAHLGMEEVMKELWPWVEEANAQCPAHARVWRSMVCLAAPEKPFKRSPKGNVVRRTTNALYEEEIKRLYGQHVQVNGNSASHAKADARETIRNAVRSVLGARAESITDDANLFSLGADSLQVMQLRQILGSAGLACTNRMVYENPSISQLARAVSSSKKDSSENNTVSREETMSAMIHRYTQFKEPVPRADNQPGAISVLLIGSTGALGTHLLHELLQNPNVGHIYCLNRSADAAERQSKTFAERGFDSAFPSKVTFLTGETSQPNFGLTEPDYTTLQQNTHLLILNAWPVNFNTTLATFEPVIAGTKRCVDFSTSSPRRPHIAFISSVASTLNYPAVRSNLDGGEAVVVPEQFDSDNSLPAKQGYGESKHVAACILAKAAAEGLVDATVLRVGQLAGTSVKVGGGVWNRHEWVPSLIRSSKSLGKIPRSLGSANDQVNWVPVDVAARTILEMVPLGAAREEGVSRAACFNVVNPRVAPWSDLAAVVQQYYSEQGRSLATVEFAEWLDGIRAVGEGKEADVAEDYPALKLLDFFESLKGDGAQGRLDFATNKGIGRSAAMAELGPVDGVLMRKWLGEWVF